MIYFLDTNMFLKFGEKVFDHYSPIVLSSETLRELEEIKVSRNKDEQIKYAARGVTRLLAFNLEKYRVVIYRDEIRDMLVERGLEETPDNKICACAAMLARTEDVIFVTADLCCQIVAKEIFGLHVEIPLHEKESIYKGYQLLKGNSAEILESMSDPEFMSKFVVNEYLLTYNTDTDSEGEMRFDGEKFVTLKLPPSKVIKAKNALQRCALDLLNNQNITIVAILGGYGSGKTWVSTRMSLYSVKEKGWQSKILFVRSPWGEGREVGFLRGSYEEKVNPFSVPIEQQLDGGSFELASLTQQGVFEFVIPYYLKGTTYPYTYILADEAEDLTEKELKLVGTRIGEGGKIVFSADIGQSLLNITDSNPLVKMCNEFKGNQMFGCIYLDEDVRSSTSKMFADLWK